MESVLTAERRANLKSSQEQQAERSSNAINVITNSAWISYDHYIEYERLTRHDTR